MSTDLWQATAQAKPPEGASNNTEIFYIGRSYSRGTFPQIDMFGYPSTLNSQMKIGFILSAAAREKELGKDHALILVKLYENELNDLKIATGALLRTGGELKKIFDGTNI